MSSMRACTPYLVMILVSLAYAGSNILSKLALENGMSYLVFIVYRHLISMAILGPLAYVFERNQRPCLTLPILARIFVLALFGTTIHQNVYYAGLDYASPTVASALSCVIPALTFVVAVSLKIERASVKSATGRAKLFGTMICIGGALIFTSWKGHLFRGILRRPLIEVHGKGPLGLATIHAKDNWIKGSALILTSYIAFSAWLILQVMVCETYPARLSMNALMCFFASLQSSVPALIFERNRASWKLDWNIQLLTIIYCGTVISCMAYYLQTYCISKRGPVFAAMFSPLVLVIVGISSAFVFAERIHLGSLVGALTIIVGLYCVLWGKNRDFNESNVRCGGEKMFKPDQQISTASESCDLA